MYGVAYLMIFLKNGTGKFFNRIEREDEILADFQQNHEVRAVSFQLP